MRKSGMNKRNKRLTSSKCGKLIEFSSPGLHNERLAEFSWFCFFSLTWSKVSVWIDKRQVVVRLFCHNYHSWNPLFWKLKGKKIVFKQLILASACLISLWYTRRVYHNEIKQAEARIKLPGEVWRARKKYKIWSMERKSNSRLCKSALKTFQVLHCSIMHT